MEKNIKDYLHYYLGQTIKTDGGYLILAAIQTEIIPCTNYRIIVLNGNHVHEAEWDDKCKLELRKLESMTEEEAQQIEHYMWEDNVDFLYDDRAEILKYFLKPWDDDYRPAFPVYVRAINWLRSKGFDCDELIESGLAIEKQPTTLNQVV